MNISSASVLLEFRQNIMSDVEKLNTHIDYRFNEAFKSPLHHHNGKEMEFHPLSELEAKTSPEVLAKARKLYIQTGAQERFKDFNSHRLS